MSPANDQPSANPSDSDTARADLSQPPDCVGVPLGLTAQVFASGMNGALKRWPAVDAREVPLTATLTLLPGWKPHRMRIATFGFTFPDGLEFIPPKEESDDAEKLERILPPKQPKRGRRNRQ